MTAKVTPVSNSSFIAGIGYDPESQVLTLQFDKGYSVSYDGVDAATAEEMREASSMGQFYHARIKGQFASRRA